MHHNTHTKGKEKEMAEKQNKLKKERTICHRITYLHYQDDHAYGSQQVLVVVQPFLHFLKAALKWNKSL